MRAKTLRSSLLGAATFALALSARADDATSPPPPPPSPPPFLAPPNLLAPTPSPVASTPLVALDPSLRASAPLRWNADAPPGAVSRRRLNPGLLIGSITMMGVTYGLSLNGALICNATGCAANEHDNFLVIPVIGPFAQMAVTENAIGNVFLAVDGLVQTASVMMFVAAYLFPQQIYIMHEGQLRVTVAPVASGASRGLGLVGEF